MRSFIKKYLRKINLGCGFDYQPGYLNVDYFNNSVADLVQSATLLDLPWDHFEEILLNDVIEHLGYCKTYFALANMYFLLKDKGIIKIKTPDIEKAFHDYLKENNPKNKENILCCIYGTEDPGMDHKFCFPSELLVEMFKRSGFSILSIERTEEVKYRPTIHMIVQKNSNKRSDIRNKVICDIHKSNKINIEYADMPYLDKIIEAFLDISNKTEIPDFIDSYKYISPRTLLFILSHKGLGPHNKKELNVLIKRGIWNIMGASKKKNTYDEALEYLKLYIESGKTPHNKQKYDSDFFTRENYDRYLRIESSQKMKNNAYIR